MTAAILRLKECQHAGIKEDDCDEMWGNLWRWEYTEKYQAPKKTQNGRLILTFAHMLRQFQSGENERWISYSRWMLITVFYGGNAITRYCFLSREPCKFMRLEIWNNEVWQGMSVPSTHLPLSEWWGKLISLPYFLLTVSETRPWPMSLHLPPSILYAGYAVNLRFKMEVQRSLSAYDIKATENRNNRNRV